MAQDHTPAESQDGHHVGDQGREDYFTSRVLNLVNVCEHVPIPRTDVCDGDMPWFDEGDLNATGYPERKINSLHAASQLRHPDFDLDAKRAQIDTGAFATVTGDKQLVHGYQEFNESFPCPIRLLPATENSDTIPAGMGYMHVVAPNANGYIPVRTFFHPSLRTTVIKEQDFLRADCLMVSEFHSELLKKYHEAGTWTFTGSSYHSKP